MRTAIHILISISILAILLYIWFGRHCGYGNLKNGLSIINTRFNMTSILYIYKSMFKDIILNINILITEKFDIVIFEKKLSNKMYCKIRKRVLPELSKVRKNVPYNTSVE